MHTPALGIFLPDGKTRARGEQEAVSAAIDSFTREDNMIRPRSTRLDIEKEMKNMQRRILLFEKEKGFLFFVIRDKKIISWGEDTDAAAHIGDIFIGRISNIQKNTGDIFVEYSEKKNCFLPARERDCCIPLNRREAKFHVGDELPIMIKKEACKNKLPVCTAKIPPKLLSAELLERAKHAYAFTRLYGGDGEFDRYLQNDPLKDGDLILTESGSLYDRLIAEPAKYGPFLKKYDDSTIRMPVLYAMDKMLSRITDKKVWLPCGGSIIIEPTEAMTVIDVNSGKNIAGADREDTLLKTNLEALDEIVYQVMARNLSGILVIDFISSESGQHKTILQDACREKFKTILPEIHYVEYTKLGLVEATRAKTSKDIYELFRENNKTILL